MRIFRAIGLGIAIVVLRFLVPAIFAGLQSMLLKMFTTVEFLLDFVQATISGLPVP